MNKIQIAALLAIGATAGAAGTKIVSNTPTDVKIEVQTVCVKNNSHDGGIDAQIETCGRVQKPGELPMRWCNIAPESAASRQMLVDAPGRMLEADVAGRARQADIKAKLEVAKTNAKKPDGGV
jgi:hypothetical protein